MSKECRPLLFGCTAGFRDTVAHRASGDAGSTGTQHGVKPLAPIRIASTALLSYAELALGFDLDGLRRGLIAVLRAERGLLPDETVALDPLTVLAFATAMAPEFVAEQWLEPLSQKLARYQDWPVPSFTLVDRAHGGVRIRVVDRVAVKVLPARRRQ